jgi:hypothetical protein
MIFMRAALVCILLRALLAFPALAASAETVVQAHVDLKGQIQIKTSDGRVHTIRTHNWQNGGGYDAVQISPDKKSVGWLANQMLNPLEDGTSYSYPVALELDVWRTNKPIRRFPASGLTIKNWAFLRNGNEVAFHIAPPHGQEFYDCTLFDVQTGKTLDHWKLDRRNYSVPVWAKKLLADEELPTANNIGYWIPDSK